MQESIECAAASASTAFWSQATQVTLPVRPCTSSARNVVRYCATTASPAPNACLTTSRPTWPIAPVTSSATADLPVSLRPRTSPATLSLAEAAVSEEVRLWTAALFSDRRLFSQWRKPFYITNIRSPTHRKFSISHGGIIATLRGRTALKTEAGRQPSGCLLHRARPTLQHLDRQAPDRPRDADGADDLPGKVAHGHGNAPDFGIELAVVEGDSSPADFLDLAPQPIRLNDGLRRERVQLGSLEMALKLIRLERGKNHLAKRGAMRGPNNAHAIGHLECTGTAGTGEDDDGRPHPHCEVAAFAGLAGKLLQDRRREAHHLDLVEGARRKREQRSADAIALGVLHLADIAERHHRLDEVKSGAVVQTDPLAQCRKPDPFAVVRHLLENCEGALDRLHAAALAVVEIKFCSGIVIGPRGREVGSLCRSCRRHPIRSHSQAVPQ